MELDDILEVISIASGEELASAIHEAVLAAANDGADMVNLEMAAVGRFRELQQQVDDGGLLSQDQLSALETLVDVVEALREYNVQAMAAAREAQERLAALASRVEPRAEMAEDAGDEDEAEAEAESVEAAVEEETEEDGGQAAPAAPAPAAPAPTSAAVSRTSRPAAPAKKPASNIPLNLMRSSRTALPGGSRRGAFGSSEDRGFRYTVSAADVPGFSSRQAITDMDSLGALVKARMQGMVRSSNSTRAGIATITRHASSRFTVNQEMDLDRVVEYVTDESHLAGGSLVQATHNSLVAAAGGTGALPRGTVWCAPMDTLWDLCPDEQGNDGFIDLPTVTTRRAGVRFPQGFDFSALWGGLGFYQTADGTSNLPTPPAVNGVGKLGVDKKCCIEIPCPDWVDCEVELIGLCIRNKILMERAWPEWTRDFTARVLKAHRRKVNAWLIAKIEALAGAKQTFAVGLPTGTPPNTTSGTHGPGATESVLSVIELLVENYRYRYRLPRGRSLEMIAPYWLLGLLRADLSKKVGNSPNRLLVSDADIIRYLALRGVRVQFVYDWQDAFSATGSHDWCTPGSDTDVPSTLPPAKIADGFGNPAGLKEWPTTVKILLYPAGSIFKLQQDIITLDGIYDHASLMENKYTSLFTEEGVNVCKRCYDPILVEITGLCPGGLSGGLGYSTCAAPVTPAPPAEGGGGGALAAATTTTTKK